jgi:hypothetical protein
MAFDARALIVFSALTAALVAGSALAQTAASAPAPTVRSEIAPPLQAAQQALSDKRFEEAMGHLRLADAVADKTAYETSLLERLRFAAAAGLEDWPTALSAVEAALATQQGDGALRGTMMDQAGIVAYRLKDYERTASWTRQALDAGAGTVSTRLRLAQSLYLMGQHPAAAQALQELASLQASRGDQPTEPQLRLQASNLLKLDDEPGYNRTVEALLRLTPTPQLWGDRLARLTQQAGFNSQLKMDVLRLGQQVRAWAEPGPLLSLAELARQAGFPHEALAVVEDGLAQGVLGQGGDAAAHAELRQRLQRLVKEDTETGAPDAKTLAGRPPAALFATGWNAATADQTATGVALMKQALAKGLPQGAGEARLRLAMVLATAGTPAQLEEAWGLLTALRDADSRDGLSDLARLWLLHLAPRS